MSRAVIAAGAGYVGSHTCKALASAGFTPVAFDNLSIDIANRFVGDRSRSAICSTLRGLHVCFAGYDPEGKIGEARDVETTSSPWRSMLFSATGRPCGS